mmetsp:Transcript_20257/g.56163  ORF Transcript_20257/g.56163 Transcript_20257/m.56163 type:complete len:416 (-) Transcript_20257:3019-4266(-)
MHAIAVHNDGSRVVVAGARQLLSLGDDMGPLALLKVKGPQVVESVRRPLTSKHPHLVSPDHSRVAVAGRGRVPLSLNGIPLAALHHIHHHVFIHAGGGGHYLWEPRRQRYIVPVSMGPLQVGPHRDVHTEAGRNEHSRGVDRGGRLHNKPVKQSHHACLRGALHLQQPPLGGPDRDIAVGNRLPGGPHTVLEEAGHCIGADGRNAGLQVVGPGKGGVVVDSGSALVKVRRHKVGTPHMVAVPEPGPEVESVHLLSQLGKQSASLGLLHVQAALAAGAGKGGVELVHRLLQLLHAAALDSHPVLIQLLALKVIVEGKQCLGGAVCVLLHIGVPVSHCDGDLTTRRQGAFRQLHKDQSLGAVAAGRRVDIELQRLAVGGALEEDVLAGLQQTSGSHELRGVDGDLHDRGPRVGCGGV